MKLWEIFRFELGYQARRGWPWLIFGALAVFVFLFVRENYVADALYDDFLVNSPFLIAGATVFGGLIWLLVAAAVAGDAAARDVATGMYPLTYTVPVGKIDYLGGRFLAAFVVNAFTLLAVQIGILLAVYSPGVAGEVVGPLRPAAYLTAYGFIALPNAFVATSIQFSLAARSGRAMAGYLGSLLLFFMAFFVASMLLFKRGLGTLLDPIGVRFVVEDLSHSWTTIEKGTRLIELEGAVLTNRVLWLGVAVAALALTYFRFRFAHRSESTWWNRGKRSPDASGVLALRRPEGQRPISVPQVPRTFGVAIHARQSLAIAWTSFRTIAASWPGLALLAAIPLLTVLVVLDQMVSSGTPLVPTTVRVLSELTAPLSAELSRWVIVPLLVVFFAGELVWRERDAGLGELTDSMPGTEWAPFLGKLLGLGLVLVTFTALVMTAGLVAQAIRGHHDFEIGLYLKILFGLQLPEYLLFALLALVVHALLDHKYIGHLVAIVAYVFIALASMFGVEHDLLVYGAGPVWSYTEMRGFGASLGPWLWFKLYWAAWALLLAVVARLLWVRGRESGLGVRLQEARRRLTRPTAWTAAVAVTLILTLGGFIFYNTNVLNEYLSESGVTKLQAEYEQRYKEHERLPQPGMTAARMHVEIHPERREVHIRGSYNLANRSGAAIGSIHVATVPGAAPGALAFDRTAALVLSDEDRGYRIYDLERPLEPGGSLRLDFLVHIEPHGFRETGVDASVAANGTFFTNARLPAIGYQTSRELTSASDRREHGLAPRPLTPSLYDVEARKNHGGGIAFEAVVGTRADQIAVAPGALRRSWTEGGRRYFHYGTSAPIGNEYGIYSANYAVREAEWRPSAASGQAVAIQVFHHPAHTANLDRMIRSVQASLDYYSEQFGPYRYDHIWLVEAPGNGVGMHAEASQVVYSEGFTTWQPEDDPQALDMPFAIVAHEMAHQWTVPYAAVEGAPVMSESLAWYYAMKAVENARGPGQLRRLLSFMRQPHPYRPIRRGEPLLRGLDPYLAYRKGPFALYAMSEYIGEERVNGALRRLLEKHRSAQVPFDSPDRALAQRAPLATTLDLYRELQAATPDSLHYLLHDLFEVNTYWDLQTERATADQAQAGSWHVTLDVRARKTVVDEAGVESEMPMDDWVQVGVFAAAGEGEESGKPIYLQMHRIRTGRQTITVTVPGRPARAGIDPNHLLVDSDLDDNSGNVKIGS